jgi:hypothetical protein
MGTSVDGGYSFNGFVVERKVGPGTAPSKAIRRPDGGSSRRFHLDAVKGSVKTFLEGLCYADRYLVVGT